MSAYSKQQKQEDKRVNNLSDDDFLEAIEQHGDNMPKDILNKFIGVDFKNDLVKKMFEHLKGYSNSKEAIFKDFKSFEGLTEYSFSMTNTTGVWNFFDSREDAKKHGINYGDSAFSEAVSLEVNNKIYGYYLVHFPFNFIDIARGLMIAELLDGDIKKVNLLYKFITVTGLIPKKDIVAMLKDYISKYSIRSALNLVNIAKFYIKNNNGVIGFHNLDHNGNHIIFGVLGNPVGVNRDETVLFNRSKKRGNVFKMLSSYRNLGGSLIDNSDDNYKFLSRKFIVNGVELSPISGNEFIGNVKANYGYLFTSLDDLFGSENEIIYLFEAMMSKKLNNTDQTILKEFMKELVLNSQVPYSKEFETQKIKPCYRKDFE